MVNCCEEERQAGFCQVVSYELWMQNVQLSVAWISKRSSKPKMDDACFINQSQFDRPEDVLGPHVALTVSGTGSPGYAWFGGLPSGS